MKLLIADDHPVFRDGLVALLRQSAPGTTVLQAASAEEALQVAGEHPDLDAVFIDLVMPGLSGEAAIREFARRHPQLPVVVLSSSEDPGDVRRMLNAGALGYIPKSASAQTIVSALKLVLSGNVYVPPLLVQPAGEQGAAAAQGVANARGQLTERQLDVARHVCDGLSNKEISLRLGIAEKTVKTHVAAIFKALNVVNRTQAARVLRDASGA